MNNVFKTLPSLGLAGLSLLALSPAQAQFGAPKVATVTARATPASVAPGGKGVLLVTITVGAKYHINAHKPNEPMYIPTLFVSQKTPGIIYGAAQFPAPKAMKLTYAPKPLLVYTGRTLISVPFTVAKTAKPGKMTLAGAVSFQGCDAKSCYPPASAPLQAAVAIK